MTTENSATYWAARAMAVNELAGVIGAINESKGFRDRFNDLEGDDEEGIRDQVVVKLALIGTEVAEAIEAVREGVEDGTEDDGKPVGLASELADIIIRTLDLADMLWIPIGDVALAKILYNQGREHMHGKTL